MKNQIQLEKVEKDKFRYVCPACTNEAFRSTNKMVGIKITCQNCGKDIITVQENYIKL